MGRQAPSHWSNHDSRLSPVTTTEQSLQPTNLVDVDDPSAVAVRFGQQTLTWENLERRARQLAQALDRDVGQGEAWAVLSHNRLEWAEMALGNTRAGTRLVPLNWHLTATELADLLVDSNSRLLVAEAALADVADQAAALAGDITVLIIDDEIATGDPGTEAGRSYQQWRNDSPGDLLTERPTGSPMLFTGGTTGRSKGVTRSDHSGPTNAWSNRWSGWAELVSKPSRGTTLITTPLYHALGLGVFTATLGQGLDVVLHRRFDPEATLASIAEHRITSTTMVPTQFIRLLKLDADIREQFDLSSLQWVLHTAAPCPQWVKRAMIDWFGPVIYELYGSSEGIGPAICSSQEWLEHPGTVGRATAPVSYSIVDDDGNDLPAGEVGTIYCKRTDGTPRYHNNKQATDASQLPDGRFTVGDLGWLDEDGFLYLADRRVDLIITGGANVYPAEIEAVLVEHPAVADIAVFGVPDDEWGQAVMAVIEPAESQSVELDEIRDFARDRLASYKLPKHFEVIEQLPREAHGKLKKRLLRDPYWQ